VSSPWTERELATLRELATTFVPGDDGDHRARLVADALDRAVDPSQVGQLRLVLRAMESRVANAALGGGATPFSAMDPAAREAYLLGWGASRLAQRRTAFASLRKLLTFLAYADPGVVGAPNPRHAAIGYQPEWPPVTPTPTPIVPTALPFAVGGPDEAMILDVPAGAPLLAITRTATDTQDEPFALSHDLFRGDRTRIVVRTPGHGGLTRTSRGRGQVIELRAQAAP